MKAPDIGYHCPLTLKDALANLSNEEIEFQPLAGGQSLLPMMHFRLAQPEVLLDLNKLAELEFIKDEGAHVHIGAMVRYSSLMRSKTVRERIPLFALALPHIAHEAIRNRGTIGGSAALADPAAEMPALLLALNATVIVISTRGQREIPADEFFLGIYETALEQDELIHSFRVPSAVPNQRFGFYELARRHGDYAMAGVAISAQTVEPYAGLRIVFFSVGDCALRALDAEAALNGAHSDDSDRLLGAQAALSGLEYREDSNATIKMKAHLARVILKRAINAMNHGAVDAQ